MAPGKVRFIGRSQLDAVFHSLMPIFWLSDFTPLAPEAHSYDAAMIAAQLPR
ncbi:MAG: hypothetical protein JXR44_04980 [Thiotrichales bacterium]|nr:hypothetical protein [Thiotrichales bacterium]